MTTDTATASNDQADKPKLRWYLASGYGLAEAVLALMLGALATSYICYGWVGFVWRYAIVVAVYGLLIPIRFLRRSALPPVGAVLIGDEAGR